MNSADTITLLGWLCYATGAAAIVVYVIHFAGRQGWKRPWNAAGLFFTAIALSQLPGLFRTAEDMADVRAAILVTACLIIATGLQAMSALRKRRERDDTPASEATAP
jgi:hypothetical protein